VSGDPHRWPVHLQRPVRKQNLPTRNFSRRNMRKHRFQQSMQRAQSVQIGVVPRRQMQIAYGCNCPPLVRMPRRRLARYLAGVYVQLGCASEPFAATPVVDILFERGAVALGPLATGCRPSTPSCLHIRAWQKRVFWAVMQRFRGAPALDSFMSPVLFFARTVLISPVPVGDNKLCFCVASIVTSILGNKDVRVVRGPPNIGAAFISCATLHAVATSSALIY